MMPIIEILLKCQRCYGLQRLSDDDNNDNDNGNRRALWKRMYGIGEYMVKEKERPKTMKNDAKI